MISFKYIPMKNFTVSTARLAFISIFVFAISFASFAQRDSASAVHFGLIYPLSTNGKHAASYTNRFSLHAIAGLSKAETGATIAGAANVIKQDASGFQIAGAANVIGNNASGVQIAGFSNIIKNEATGAQIAGFAIVSGSSGSAQIAGFTN